MSKIGAKPVTINEGTSVLTEDKVVVVKGALGEVRINLPDNLKVELGDREVRVRRLSDDLKTKANHGTVIRLIVNALVGVTRGFQKTLEVVGTGFRPQMEGEMLVLSLGFSHPVKFIPPAGIKLEVQGNKIKVSGVEKEKVGLVADQIKHLKKPDPYKGKGIRYEGEKLKLKPGKIAAKAVGSAGGK